MAKLNVSRWSQNRLWQWAAHPVHEGFRNRTYPLECRIGCSSGPPTITYSKDHLMKYVTVCIDLMPESAAAADRSTGAGQALPPNIDHHITFHYVSNLSIIPEDTQFIDMVSDSAAVMDSSSGAERARILIITDLQVDDVTECIVLVAESTAAVDSS